MEYNQDQTSLTNQGVTEISHSFRLVIARKTGNEISPSSRLEFLEKLLATILLYQMQNTTLPGQRIEEV